MPTPKKQSSMPFFEAWTRGWMIILMMIVIHLAGSLVLLPVAILPESVQGIVGLVAFLLFVPPVCFWTFRMFYPDLDNSAPDPNGPGFKPTVCFACTADMPENSDTCRECGWTYKTPRST